MFLSSVSEQVLGTNRPFLLPIVLNYYYCTLSQATHNTGSSDGAMDDWNHGTQFTLEDTVEILASSYAD